MANVPPPVPVEPDTSVPSPSDPVGPPRLAAESGADAESWRGALRHFHLTGEAVGPVARAAPTEFEPALLGGLLQPMTLVRGWPVLLPDAATNGTDATAARLGEVLEAALVELGTGSMLAGEAPRLVRAFDRTLAGLNEVVALGDLADDALAAFRTEFELSDAAGEAFDNELARLREVLPSGGLLIGLGPYAAIELHAWTLRRARAQRVTEFVEEARALRNQMADLLKLEDGRSAVGRSAAALSDGLGGAGDLFNADALADSLPAHRGTEHMSEERRARVDATRAALDSFIDDAADADDLILVHGGILPEGADAAGARVEQAEDPLVAASTVFDQQVDRMVEVFKAVRVARLEVDNAFDEDLHGPSLGRFCWQGLDAGELLLVPTVVALDTASRLQEERLGSLSNLLHSGRPVQVIALEDTTAAPRAGDRRLPTSHGTDLGYRLVAHREAFVLQSTLARPDHLIAGLGLMSRAVRPAVALIARPSWSGSWPWLELTAAHEGRATPCFLYDPDAGETFADRFALAGNPSPELPWPQHSVDVVDADAQPQVIEAAFTFADAAATDPAWRDHLLLVPAAAWNDELAPVSEWVEAAGSELPLTIPFVLVVTADGDLGRAVLTRELAFACRDRRQGWRIVQELSGVDNAWANLAAEKARAEAEAGMQARIDALQAEHATALDAARAEAAGEAMERLAAVLLNLDTAAVAVAPAASAPAAVAPTTAAPVAEAAQESVVAAVEEEEDDDDVSFDDPFIDTPLCTTCNECTGINPLLFKYDDNKQAFIDDVSAGTFKQLVVAAEKCPAKCIHPGVPREGDDSVNDDLLARAAPFN